MRYPRSPRYLDRLFRVIRRELPDDVPDRDVLLLRLARELAPWRVPLPYALTPSPALVAAYLNDAAEMKWVSRRHARWALERARRAREECERRTAEPYVPPTGDDA